MKCMADIEILGVKGLFMKLRVLENSISVLEESKKLVSKKWKNFFIN